MKAVENDMHTALTMLRRHINPLESPLYRLPPDLFPEIASHLVNETDLINTTHVSYHLRNTLLHCPSIWSHLNFEREMMARAFFERSGQVSLHVDMASDAARTVASLAELRKQSKRITTLKLRNCSIQREFLSEPLPSLRRLEIFSEYPYGWVEWNGEWDDTWAPVWGPRKEAASWSFPSLTSLIIYRLDPRSFHVPNLTRFKFWDREGFAETMDLLVFLDNCPLLEHIDISHEGVIYKSDLVISLPSLRTYTQTNFGEGCSLTVFDALSLPPFCSVTLRFQEDGKPIAAAHHRLPPFKNPDYLTEIKRVKFGTTHSAGGVEVAGTLELINAKGTRVHSERVISGDELKSPAPEVRIHTPNTGHLDFVQGLCDRSVENLFYFY